jgi:hypothetical protein
MKLLFDVPSVAGGAHFLCASNEGIPMVNLLLIKKSATN